jgi:hypothetical protein
VPGEHFVQRDVADGTRQADVVEMLYVTLNQTSHILKPQINGWRTDRQTLLLALIGLECASFLF